VRLLKAAVLPFIFYEAVRLRFRCASYAGHTSATARLRQAASPRQPSLASLDRTE